MYTKYTAVKGSPAANTASTNNTHQTQKPSKFATCTRRQYYQATTMVATDKYHHLIEVRVLPTTPSPSERREGDVARDVLRKYIC